MSLTAFEPMVRKTMMVGTCADASDVMVTGKKEKEPPAIPLKCMCPANQIPPAIVPHFEDLAFNIPVFGVQFPKP